MNAKMIILSCLLIGMMSSCTDDAELELDVVESQFESTGMIKGSDIRFCPCCGGWILEIDNDKKEYRIEELPADSGIELNQDTLSVKFNWSIDRECSSLIYINIEEIALN